VEGKIAYSILHGTNLPLNLAIIPVCSTWIGSPLQRNTWISNMERSRDGLERVYR